MDHKWEKMNSVLFHKIREYDPQKMENHYDLVQFQNEQKKILEEIEEKARKRKCIYIFPRKIHESQKACDKEDALLAQQLPGKTYNLYNQNHHQEGSRDTRRSSFHIGKPSSKNQFVVRKNNRPQLSQNKSERVPSQFTQLSNSQDIPRVMRQASSQKNYHTKNFVENHRIVQIVNNVHKSSKDSKQLNSPKVIKKRSILLRQNSGSSMNSVKENKQNRIENFIDSLVNALKRTVKSKFNESRVLPRIQTEYIEE